MKILALLRGIHLSQGKLRWLGGMGPFSISPQVRRNTGRHRVIQNLVAWTRLKWANPQRRQK
jgi:hypothetical protein